jgi:large conductance mechanosensitive channel protein
MGKVRKFFEDFKKFISKGNVIDLAVAVIIGGAFGKIVASLVNDIIMPLVTGAMGANTLKELSLVIKPAVYSPDGLLITEALTLNWGSFLQSIIDFLIISFFVFLFVRMLSAAKSVAEKAAEKLIADKQEAEKAAEEAKTEAAKKEKTVPEEVRLLREIRDLLVREKGAGNRE